MIEVTLYGRGGQGGVTLAKLIAMAWFSRGKQAQAFGVYAAERSGAPIQAYVRIDDEEITNHNQIREPDHVIVLDTTLIGESILAGARADGWINGVECFLRGTDVVAAVAALFEQSKHLIEGEPERPRDGTQHGRIDDGHGARAEAMLRPPAYSIPGWADVPRSVPDRGPRAVPSAARSPRLATPSAPRATTCRRSSPPPRTVTTTALWPCCSRHRRFPASAAASVQRPAWARATAMHSMRE